MTAFDLAVGAELPPVEMPPVTRAQLALYAGGSHDHTTVHIDTDAAVAFGFPDVFAQGMFVMALLGRAVTRNVPQKRLKQFTARFVGKTQIGDRLTARGKVVERYDSGDARVELSFTTQSGEVRLKGEIVVDGSA